MKELFKVGKTSFSNKMEAKKERNLTGYPLLMGTDHIGTHGSNSVSVHMRNKRKGR